MHQLDSGEGEALPAVHRGYRVEDLLPKKRKARGFEVRGPFCISGTCIPGLTPRGSTVVRDGRC